MRLEQKFFTSSQGRLGETVWILNCLKSCLCFFPSYEFFDSWGSKDFHFCIIQTESGCCSLIRSKWSGRIVLEGTLEGFWCQDVRELSHYFNASWPCKSTGVWIHYPRWVLFRYWWHFFSSGFVSSDGVRCSTHWSFFLPFLSLDFQMTLCDLILFHIQRPLCFVLQFLWNALSVYCCFLSLRARGDKRVLFICLLKVVTCNEKSLNPSAVHGST